MQKPFNNSLTASEILQELRGLMTGRWLTDLANMSAHLFLNVKDINWVGFYLTDETDKNLWLGPFQGKPACTMIPFAKGVCGTAAQNKKSMLVTDVDLFPGHIVCDSESRSEVVIPLIVNGQVKGVLDIDSPLLARFDQQDQSFFETAVQILLEKNNF